MFFSDAKLLIFFETDKPFRKIFLLNLHHTKKTKKLKKGFKGLKLPSKPL